MAGAGVVEKLRAAGPIFRTRDARALGVHWRDLYALRDAGVIIELSRGLYRFADAGGVTNIDLVTVSRRVPHGMICLLSALAYWELTDEIPYAVDLAVPRGSRRPAIGYPPTHVHVFDRRTFELGRELVEVSEKEIIAISNGERTIVDMFRFRNRLGTDLANQALREYLLKRNAKPAEVVRLAERLRVAGPVRQAMEVLLQ